MDINAMGAVHRVDPNIQHALEQAAQQQAAQQQLYQMLEFAMRAPNEVRRIQTSTVGVELEPSGLMVLKIALLTGNRIDVALSPQVAQHIAALLAAELDRVDGA